MAYFNRQYLRVTIANRGDHRSVRSARAKERDGSWHVAEGFFKLRSTFDWHYRRIGRCAPLCPHSSSGRIPWRDSSA
jgi:hypothetical protein